MYIIKKEKKKKLLKEYEEKKDLYGSFLLSVDKLIKKTLNSRGLKYQLNNRVKTADSLSYKLDKLGSVSTVLSINDVAGYRVLCYLHKDMQNIERILINKLSKYFDFHRIERKHTKDGYQATHLVIEYKEEKLKFKKYSKHRGLRCEIQITTLLYHVWSEANHDTLYKEDIQSENFDRKTLDYLNKRAEKAMELVRKAQLEIDSFNEDYIDKKMLVEFFNSDFFVGIKNTKNTEELYSHLSTLKNNLYKLDNAMLESILDKVNFLEIIEFSIDKTEDVRKNSHTEDNILDDILLDIIGYYVFRFIYPLEIFKILIRIYKNNNFKNKDKIINIGLEVVSFSVTKKEGVYNYQNRLLILDFIEKMSNQEISDNSYFLSQIINKCIGLEYSHTELKDLDVVSFNRGKITLDDGICKMQLKSLNILENIYFNSDNLNIKNNILQNLQNEFLNYGTQKESDEFFIKILDQIFDFYINILKTTNDYPSIGLINENINYLERNYRNQVNSCKNIKHLKNLIDDNKTYKIYKNLFIEDYHNYESGSEEAYKEEIDKYIESINSSNYYKWENIIIDITKDFDGLLNFYLNRKYCYFLESLGSNKIEFAQKLIKNNKKELHSSLLHIVVGIGKSENQNIVKDILKKWINENQCFRACLDIMLELKINDLDIITALFSKAKATKDLDIMNRIILLIIREANKESDEYFSLFKNCTREIIENNNEWVFSSFNLSNENISSFLDNLNDQNRKTLINELLFVHNIGYTTEYFLIYYMHSYPILFINFFIQRILLEQTLLKRQGGLIFRAVPHQFSFISNEKISDDNVDAIVDCYLNNHKNIKKYYIIYGENLLAKLFPNFPDKLKDKLINFFINSNNDKTAFQEVIDILYNYEEKLSEDPSKGDKNKLEANIDKIYREIILIIKENEWKALFDIITNHRGAFWGNDGMIRRFENKKTRFGKWLEDDNKTVKKFAKQFRKYLDNRIAREKSEVDYDEGMRRLEYDNDSK